MKTLKVLNFKVKREAAKLKGFNLRKKKSAGELYKLTMKLRVPKEVLYQKSKEFFVGEGYLVERERQPTFLLVMGLEGRWRIQIKEKGETTKIELSFESFLSRLNKEQEEKIRKELTNFVAYIQNL